MYRRRCADVRCQRDNGLFDGEARCMSVDNMKRTNARVVQPTASSDVQQSAMWAAERADTTKQGR
jgi:hypothetical protein